MASPSWRIPVYGLSRVDNGPTINTDGSRDNNVLQIRDPTSTRAGSSTCPPKVSIRLLYRHKVLVACLFAVFGVIELWSPIAHGTYLLPSDIGQRWPITNVASQPPVARNPLQTDVYVDFGPFLHFDVANVTHGQLPLWNPYDGNGEPYLADDQTVVLSPFTLPFYVLGLRWALIASALARLWLLGFFTFLFLVRQRLNEMSAIVGGLLFAYAGYHLVWLDYQTHISVSACLPIGLWSLRVAFDNRGGDRRERTKRGLALLALSLVLASFVYDGHPETAVFDLLLLGLYALIVLAVEQRRWRDRLRWVGRFVGVAALGVGLSAIQLLPLLQYESDGARPAALRDNPETSVAGFLPDTVPLMAFPNLFGGPQYSYNDVGFFTRHPPQNNYAEVDGNTIGLLGLCLVPLGLLGLLRRRHEALAIFAFAALVAGTVALYTRASGLLWHHVPFVGAAGLNRSQDVQLLGIAILGAFGVDWVMRGVVDSGEDAALEHRREMHFGRWMPSVRPYNLRIAAVALSFTAVSLFLVLGAQHLRRLVSHLPNSAASTAVALGIARRNVVIELCIAFGFAIVLVVCALALRWRRNKSSRRTTAVGHMIWGLIYLAAGLSMCVLAFSSNGLVMRAYNPSVPASMVYPQTPAVRQLSQIVGSGESLFAAASFPPASTNLWFGLHDVGSYDAIGFKWHDALYNEVFATPTPGVEQMPSCLNALQLFGVTSVVGGNGQWAKTSVGGLARTTSVKGIPVYRVPGSSFVSVAGSHVDADGGDKNALRLVGSCSFNSENTVVLDNSPYNADKAGSLGAVSGSTANGGNAHVLSQGSDSLSIRATGGRDSWLVIRQAWAPGWVATVDGRTVSLHRADVAFQAVQLPTGTHMVKLLYRPSSVAVGAWITELSLFAAIACGFTIVWRQRRS